MANWLRYKSSSPRTSERNRRKLVLFWLRFGGFMGFALGAMLVPASLIGGVALMVASGWVIFSPVSSAALSLGLGLLLVGVASFARVFEIEDRPAVGAWAIAAGSVVLVNTRSLRALTAALAAPTPDELEQQAFEDLIEEIRPLTMATDPNRIEFETGGFLSGKAHWTGRLRDSDAVLETTISSEDGESRQAVNIRKDELQIELRGTTALGKPLKAGFRIGDLQLKGTISGEAHKRYKAWKATATS